MNRAHCCTSSRRDSRRIIRWSALGLAVIGWVSDALAEDYGSLSLTISVFAVCLVSGIAAMAVFAWTAAQMGKTGYLERMASDPA